MLCNNRVASHQVGTGYSCQLIERKIPRFYAKNNAYGSGRYIGFAKTDVQRFVSQKKSGIISVVIKNIRTESDFPLGFSKKFSHLLRCKFGKLVAVFA